jgi:hypothetical protein
MSLIKLITDESRKSMTKDTIEGIQSRTEDRLKKMNEELEQLKKQIEEKNAAQANSSANKILGWLGAALGIIAAVAAVVVTAGAATPVLVGAVILVGVALAGMGMKIAQEATDGDYFPGKLFSKMLQAMGVDEKAADIAGMAVVGGLMIIGSVAGAIMTGGASAASTVENIAQMVKTIAVIISCAASIAQGGLAIDSALHQYESDMAGVELKELQALLEKLKELTDMEEDFLKAVTQEDQALTDTLKRILEGLSETIKSLVADLSTGGPAPSMA